MVYLEAVRYMCMRQLFKFSQVVVTTVSRRNLVSILMPHL